MGSIHFHRGRARTRRSRQYRRKVRERFGYVQAMLLTIGLSVAGIIGVIGIGVAGTGSASELECKSVDVIDGDTFDCDGQRIRLQGIDAPELPGHCRKGRDCTPGNPYASTESLSRMTAFSTVTCRKTDTDHYGRTVARCMAGKKDMSCRQIEGGYAVRRYGNIFC